MSLRCLTITAPSRLHFGLLAFGHADARQFGGVGMMIEEPGIELRTSAASRFEASGHYADRVAEFARRWAEFYQGRDLPACALDVTRAAPQHSGLGVGTQLALSVATALHAWLGEPIPSAPQLARSVGRGQRSAIGVYGFLEGGLIVERGRLREEDLSPLDCRVLLPETWRVVLVCPQGVAGLSGAAECDAFQRLPPVPAETTERLVEELREHLVPAALQGDFEAFSASVYRYGHEAGLCYAAVQHGPYNGPLVTRIVDDLRARGVAGVGQSSWGPTVFALQPTEDAARALTTSLRAEPYLEGALIITSRLWNRGVKVAEH